MTKVLGLELGTNSIGWALIDTDKNKLLNAGVEFSQTLTLKTGV